jgi:hypothetical protein
LTVKPTRRQFLTTASAGAWGLSSLGLAIPNLAVAAEKSARGGASAIVIIGGGLGGCAAALSALKLGAQVVMTEETDWIGGQMTSQAVPPDDNKWIESHGATATYQELRRRIRDYYRRNYPLTDAARAIVELNPGNGGVSRLCHEPRVSVAALYEMLGPYLGSGKLHILLNTKAISADIEGNRVRSVMVRNSHSGTETILNAPWFIDATETGELLPLTKTEYVTGAESRKVTGEPHAPEEAQPQNIQSFTCCFAIEHRAGEDHTIDKPRDYAFWRDYVPNLTPPWTSKLLSWEYIHPITLKPYPCLVDFTGEYTKEGSRNLWRYRRIIDKSNFVEGAYLGDTTLVNWPQNDYWLGNNYEVSDEEAKKNLDSAKQLSLSLLNWMQTEAVRPDGGIGLPGLLLRKDLVDTEDGLAKYPYIRESRRIKADFTVLEKHVGKDARMAETGKSKDEVSAEVFPDSVGIGYYRIDLHPSSGGTNYIDIDSMPFQIPLGALIPQRVENLLPACKNLGVTHLTNGCYRLHPVEWNIGESAGALAAHCIEHKLAPRDVRNKPERLAEFQKRLEQLGVRLSWPDGTRT